MWGEGWGFGGLTLRVRLDPSGSTEGEKKCPNKNDEFRGRRHQAIRAR